MTFAAPEDFRNLGRFYHAVSLGKDHRRPLLRHRPRLDRVPEDAVEPGEGEGDVTGFEGEDGRGAVVFP